MSRYGHKGAFIAFLKNFMKLKYYNNGGVMEIFRLESETYLSTCRKNVFSITAVFIMILILYSNTFDASWHFDDEQNILERKAIHLTELTWPQIKKTFFDDEGKFYRPAACLSLALNYYIGKTNIFGYHAVNIFIHFLASIFLFLFIYHTLNLPFLKARYGPNSYFIALLATALWAINPLQTQAVTYIVQRMASIAGMFYIMSMYFYLKGRTSEQRLVSPAHYFMCLFCGILAFGSKQNAAMLPISILLFDLFLIQGLTKENIKKNSFILLVLILTPLTLAVIHEGPSIFHPKQLFSGYEHRPFTLVERLLTEPRIILFYISLLLYPMPDRLSICHDIAISHSLINPLTTIISILVILIILCLTIIKSRKWPFISYCIIFYFLNHLIESSIFSLELIFEHRNYIPSMLFFAPIAILALKGIKFFSYKQSMQVIFTVFIVLVLIGQGHSAFMRNFIWKTEESLWIDATEKAPDLIRPWNNLGNFYSSRNLHEEALTQYIKALPKKDIHTKKKGRCLAYYNIGLTYSEMGEKDKALRYYQEAEKISPSFADTHNNKGILLLEKDLFDEARQEFEKAIRYDNKHYEAHNNIGFLLLKTGKTEKAIPKLEMALKIKSNNPMALKNLGYAYRIKGSYGRAFLLFNKGIQHKYPDPGLFLYLSEIFYIRGKNDQAEKLISRFVSSGKDADIRKYIEGVAKKEERLQKIRKIKETVLKRLLEVYSKRVSLVSEGIEYLEKKGNR